MYAYYDPKDLVNKEAYKEQFGTSIKFNPNFPQVYEDVDEVGFICPKFSEIIEDEYTEQNFFKDYDNNNLDMENYVKSIEKAFD